MQEAYDKLRTLQEEIATREKGNEPEDLTLQGIKDYFPGFITIIEECGFDVKDAELLDDLHRVLSAYVVGQWGQMHREITELRLRSAINEEEEIRRYSDHNKYYKSEQFFIEFISTIEKKVEWYNHNIETYLPQHRSSKYLVNQAKLTEELNTVRNSSVFQNRIERLDNMG